ncbi:MAG TPA: hypothetical protein VM598_09555, partial [Bdellovibrionota bacterium]|nr:hypothetical protein [Bdellovibrionota bacterium]
FKRPCGSTFEYFWAAGTRKPITGMLITYDINGIIVGTRETGVVVDGRRRYNGGLGQISGAEWETYLALTKK